MFRDYHCEDLRHTLTFSHVGKSGGKRSHGRGHSRSLNLLVILGVIK
jgi:hypothetical protein